MSVGFVWSRGFILQFADKDVRDAYMADQVRTRIALQIRALREQPGREWSQNELGRRAGKSQNVISRLEDPDYGKLTLETLFKIAAAFDLPLLVDMPEWENWFEQVDDVTSRSLYRQSFDADRLAKLADDRAKKSEAVAAFARVWMGQQPVNGLYEKVANLNAIPAGQATSVGGFNVGTALPAARAA